MLPDKEMEPLRLERLAVIKMEPPLPELRPELAARVPPRREMEPEKREMEPPLLLAERIRESPDWIEREADLSKARKEMEPALLPEATRAAKVPLGVGEPEPMRKLLEENWKREMEPPLAETEETSIDRPPDCPAIEMLLAKILTVPPVVVLEEALIVLMETSAVLDRRVIAPGEEPEAEVEELRLKPKPMRLVLASRMMEPEEELGAEVEVVRSSEREMEPEELAARMVPPLLAEEEVKILPRERLLEEAEITTGPEALPELRVTI